MPVSDPTLSANNQLHAFAVNGTTGALTAVPPLWGPIAANEVINSAVLSPNGASLYLASSTPLIVGPPLVPPTGRITQIAVNPQTGALSPTASSQVNGGQQLVQRALHASGGHAYVHA